MGITLPGIYTKVVVFFWAKNEMVWCTVSFDHVLKPERF